MSDTDDNALQAADDAIERLDPENASGWMQRGFALASLKRSEEALTAFTKATELDPANSEAWARRAQTLHNLDRHEEALEAADKAIRSSTPTTRTHGCNAGSH